MATAELEAHVREGDGPVAIELIGEVDGRAEAAARGRLRAGRGSRRRAPRLLTASTYMNSTGIALIVGLLAKARTNGQTLSARGLTQHYREIFEITRLSDFMTIVDDEEGSA